MHHHPENSQTAFISPSIKNQRGWQIRVFVTIPWTNTTSGAVRRFSWDWLQLQVFLEGRGSSAQAQQPQREMMHSPERFDNTTPNLVLGMLFSQKRIALSFTEFYSAIPNVNQVCNTSPSLGESDSILPNFTQFHRT